jgi:site-specific DNA-cytosine methylase
MMTKQQYKAVGIHIYAGGFTLGVKRAGFKVLCHLEETAYGTAAVRMNWPDMKIYIGENRWPHEWEPVDLLYSNPPCAVFSSMGRPTLCRKQGYEWSTDPRLSCWKRAFVVFQEMRPRIFALESVCQAYTKGRAIVDEFTERSLRMGYSVYHMYVNAKWTGIPQSRKRFFYVAYRHELEFSPTFEFRRPPAVDEVLASVESPGVIRSDGPNANFGQWIKYAAPGEKLADVYLKHNPVPRKNHLGGRMGCPGMLYYRLPVGKQMGTFMGNFYGHPTENRFIGINEMRAMCGYPLEYRFPKVGSTGVGSPPRLMARAVLPPVGEWLGRTAANALSRRAATRTQSVKFIDLREPGNSVVELSNMYGM